MYISRTHPWLEKQPIHGVSCGLCVMQWIEERVSKWEHPTTIAAPMRSGTAPCSSHAVVCERRTGRAYLSPSVSSTTVWVKAFSIFCTACWKPAISFDPLLQNDLPRQIQQVLQNWNLLRFGALVCSVGETSSHTASGQSAFMACFETHPLHVALGIRLQKGLLAFCYSLYYLNLSLPLIFPFRTPISSLLSARFLWEAQLISLLFSPIFYHSLSILF